MNQPEFHDLCIKLLDVSGSPLFKGALVPRISSVFLPDGEQCFVKETAEFLSVAISGDMDRKVYFWPKTDIDGIVEFHTDDAEVVATAIQARVILDLLADV